MCGTRNRNVCCGGDDGGKDEDVVTVFSHGISLHLWKLRTHFIDITPDEVILKFYRFLFSENDFQSENPWEFLFSFNSWQKMRLTAMQCISQRHSCNTNKNVDTFNRILAMMVKGIVITRFGAQFNADAHYCFDFALSIKCDSHAQRTHTHIRDRTNITGYHFVWNKLLANNGAHNEQKTKNK